MIGDALARRPEACRIGRNLAVAAGARVGDRDDAALRVAVDEVRLARIGHREEAVPEGERLPVLAADALVERRPAGPAPVEVVLQAAADVVRLPKVVVDVIELAERDRVQVLERLPPVPRLIHAAVVAVQHAVRVRRVDPERVVIGVDVRADDAEALAAVARHPQVAAENEDLLGILRVDADHAEVEGAEHDPRVLVDDVPGVAAIVGPEEHARVLELGDHVDGLGLARRHGDADPILRLIGQAAREVLPRLSAVHRSIEAGLAGAAVQAPGAPPVGVHPGVDDAGIRRIDLDVGAAGIRVEVEHLRPGPAAVGRLEEAALLVRAPLVTERGDVGDVRVSRVDADARDPLGVGEAEMRPRLAGVGRPIDAVAERHAVARIALARAYPHDVAIGGRDGDRADREHRLMIEKRPERRARVGRLPDAAVRTADIEGGRVAGIASIAVTRPPVLAGPSDRHFRAARGLSAGAGACCAVVRRPSERAAPSATTNSVRFMAGILSEGETGSVDSR